MYNKINELKQDIIGAVEQSMNDNALPIYIQFISYNLDTTYIEAITNSNHNNAGYFVTIVRIKIKEKFNHYF